MWASGPRFDLWRRVRVVRMERMLWCLNALAVARDSQTYRQSWRCSVSRCIVIVFELIQHMVLMAGQPRVSSSTRSIVCCVLGESDEQGQQNQVNHPQVVFNSIPVGEVPCQSIPKHLLREDSTNLFFNYDNLKFSGSFSLLAGEVAVLQLLLHQLQLTASRWLLIPILIMLMVAMVAVNIEWCYRFTLRPFPLPFTPLLNAGEQLKCIC